MDQNTNNNINDNNVSNNNYTEAQNSTNSNINQVTNQMSQIPNNNYAFQQSQVNTNVNQSVNLSNPQQKKKSKAVIIISILLIIAIIGILLIILLGHRNSSSNSDNPINNDSNNQINNNQNSNSKKITSWLQTIKKTELKEPTYLYDEKFVLPITVENFAEVEKPLHPSLGAVSSDVGSEINDINLVTSSDRVLNHNSEISLFSSEVNLEWPDLILTNYGDQTITVSEAFTNNWWYLQKFTSDEFENDPGEAFGLPEQSIWDINTMTSPALDQLMDTIGSPSYALITYGAIDEDGYFFYDLVWEYENYTIVIPVMEGKNLSKNTYSILKLYGVEYYTKESWEYAKKDSKIISVYEF